MAEGEKGQRGEILIQAEMAAFWRVDGEGIEFGSGRRWVEEGQERRLWWDEVSEELVHLLLEGDHLSYIPWIRKSQPPYYLSSFLSFLFFLVIPAKDGY